MKIAIVGCGPKGLFALERLLAQAADVPGPLIDVDIYDPHPTPGAGPVYDPGQPRFMRMNFSSRQVDMWWRGDGPHAPTHRPTFSEWRGDPADDYAPRAEVGRYLAAGFRRLMAAKPSRVRVAIHRRAVEAVRRSGRRWAIHTHDEVEGEFERVLIATGHEQFRPGAVTSDTEVPATGTIAIRGFALTFIDAALSLSEGRGGEFVDDDRGGLAYRGNDRSLRIIPYSRTGRMMLQKPADAEFDPRRAAACTSLVNSLASPIEDVSQELVPAIVKMLPLEHRARCRRWLAASDSAECARIDVGPDAGAAVGRIWRAVYPALVARLSGNGIADDQWPIFRRLSAEMERVAFGPAPINAAKLRALINAGVVVPARSVGPPPQADVMIDAVMPPPGVPPRGLLRELVNDGHARIAPNRRGLEISQSCECIGWNGEPTEGLAAYGRPTEDWVIGNDTLSRSLHPQIDHWARAVSVGERRAVHV